jgi:hypothetical protein
MKLNNPTQSEFSTKTQTVFDPITHGTHGIMHVIHYTNYLSILSVSVKQTQKYNPSVTISTSSSIEITKTTYQPGGTATLLTGNLIGRSSRTIKDESGLGRWSGFQLKTNFNNQHLNIITVYRPVITNGIHTCFQQKIAILKSKGIKTPNPRQQLLTDLASVIQNFNRNNDSTIIMMDANEGLYNQNSKLTTFLATTNLTPLIENPQHYPPTHKRGQQCIDFIFGSPNLQTYILASGITAFYEHPWPLTDHRGLFIDIDILGLFGASLHTPLPTPPKRLSSLSRPMIQKFINKLEQTNSLPHLLEQLNELNSINTWTDQQHSLLESIDNQFTKILLTAEEESAMPINYPWSPELDKASLLYTYWIIIINGKTSRIDTATQLDTIAQKLGDIDIYQDNKNRRPLAQMRLARRNLINCQLESQQKRDIHLNIQHDISIEKGQMTQAQAIRIKINRERQRRCWKLLRNIIHGHKTAGGLSHILIPNTTNDPTFPDPPPRRIQIKQELDPVLLTRNINHFRQAHGTPFTIQPLLNIFGSDGCNDAAIAAINGNIPDKYESRFL